MILSAIAGTLAILLTQVVLVTAFVGVGLLTRRAFGVRSLAIRDVIVAFWVGVAIVVALLYAWTYVFPINAVPLTVVLVIGLLALVPWRGALRALGQGEEWSRTWWIPVALLVSALWVANLCRGPLVNSDSTLYHFQGVLWAKAYPTVPGLANLFGPLGFNNGSFVYDALLDVGPWSGESHHIANGLLMQVFMAHALLGLFKLLRGTGSERLQGVFDAVLLAPATNMVVQDWLTSFATDLPETVFLFMAASESFRLLTDHEEAPQAALERAYRVFCVLAFMAIAVTFKVSVAVVAVVLALVVLGKWILVHRPPRAILRMGLLWGIAAPALIAMAWIGRGVILSGYPFFPSSALSFRVDWRAPTEHADCEFAYAAFSSRASVDEREVITGEVGIEGWFPRWFEESAIADLHMLVIPAAIVLAAALLLVLVSVLHRRVDVGPTGWLLAMPAAVGLVAWFVLAPEPRYGSPLVWILAAVTTAACFQRLGGGSSLSSARRFYAALLIVGLSPLMLHPILSALPSHRQLAAWRRVFAEDALLPGPVSALHPSPLHPKLSRYVTRSGLELAYTARNCFDTPIPCTPNPAPNLRLRVPGRIASGFTVDDSWQMQFWPANRPRFGAAIAELDRQTDGRGCRAASRNTALRRGAS